MIRIWPAYFKAAKLAAADQGITLGVWLENRIRESVPVKFRKGLK